MQVCEKGIDDVHEYAPRLVSEIQGKKSLSPQKSLDMLFVLYEGLLSIDKNLLDRKYHDELQNNV